MQRDECRVVEEDSWPKDSLNSQDGKENQVEVKGFWAGQKKKRDRTNGGGRNIGRKPDEKKLVGTNRGGMG